MTDRQPTPREEAALRRLLRDARHDGPVPPEVAARTEETLAALGAGGRDADPAGHGGPDHHRRRRAATALLVAAVSVVVVGIGVGQVLRPATEQLTGSADSSAGEAARDTPPDRAAPQEQAPDAAAGSDGSVEQGGAGARSGSAVRSGVPVEQLALVAEPPAVSAARFARDVARVRRLQQAERPRRTTLADRGRLAARDPAPGFTCARADWGAGRVVAVLYEQAPAVLVLRPATRATRVADLVECGSGDVVRSITLTR